MAAKPRDAFEFTLPRGPRVVLVVLTCTEVLTALRSAGDAGPLMTRLECARHALRELDGRKVAYTDVAGGQIDKLIPRAATQISLGQAWARLHEPNEAEVEAAKSSLTCEEGPEESSWTARLSDGRQVVFGELRPVTIDQAIKRARQSGRSEAVQQLSAAIEHLRASVRSIDGKPLGEQDLEGSAWDALFSMKDTMLLSAAWQEAFSGPSMVGVGEPRPVSGTR